MLTIGVATVAENFYKTIENLSKLNIDDNRVCFVVICQLFGNDKDSLFRKISKLNFSEKYLNIYYSDEEGISNSRNLAIEKCQSKYLWFVDDDFVFVEHEMNCLVRQLALSKTDIMLIRIRSLENPAMFYKDYANHPVGFNRSKLYLLKASSIEIVVRKDFVIKNKIYFNNSFGLGSLYPCGEENLFLFDFIDAGGSVFYSELAPICHTILPDNREPISERHYLARGFLASKFNFFLFSALIFRWSFRGHPKFNFLQRLKFLYNGKNITK
jgi:hypothetical protein